jgi:outer membrane protein OmpA-like peptidoglycan-associated protein
MKLLLACISLTTTACVAQSSFRTAAQIERMLHPEKQSARTGSFTYKTRGKASEAAPLTFSTLKRTAAISPESQRMLSLGGVAGSVIVRPNPDAAKTAAPAPSSGSYPASKSYQASAPAPAVAEVKVYEQTRAAFSNILFKRGSIEFADETSRQQVANIASALHAHPTARYVIEGHTCDLGDDQNNKTLSLDRAQAVANHLMRSGVKAEQLIVLGFGETEQLSRPSALDSTEKAEVIRASNRRVGVGRVAE